MSEPPCFGQLWDAKSVECRGGADPTYINPADGTNRRDICQWYSQCGARTQARNQAQQQYIPVQQLVRPPIPTINQQMPPTPQMQPFQNFTQGLAQIARPLIQSFQQTQQPQQQMIQVQQQQQPQMRPPQPQYPQPQYGFAQPILVDPRMAANPYVVPMNYPGPGQQMPAYLTVPEPLNGQPWYVRLASVLLRSMLKATGHSIANYFDHTSFYSWPNPPPG